jgi:hypothetical protein
MAKRILAVTNRYPKEVEDRIDRDYNARRNPDQLPFTEQKLLATTDGADALFITGGRPVGFRIFPECFVHGKNHRHVRGGFRAYRSGSRRS